MARTTEESSLAKKVLDYLEELQLKGEPLYYEHRSGSGGWNYKRGVPDLFFVYNGLHVEVELKAPNGKLSTMQEKWKWKCECLWNILYLCPRTFEEVVEFIKQLQ